MLEYHLFSFVHSGYYRPEPILLSGAPLLLKLPLLLLLRMRIDEWRTQSGEHQRPLNVQQQTETLRKKLGSPSEMPESLQKR